MVSRSSQHLPDGTDSRDEEALWIDKIRNGDYHAFEALFRAYCAELVAFARRFVGRNDVAEEIVQDVFFNIWAGRQDWMPRGVLRTYLYGAVRNHCLAYRRHRLVEVRYEARVKARPPSYAENPENLFRYAELQKALEQAISSLPERRRLIFELSRYQGLTYLEIAALLNLSVKTVENQMVRALRFLRERLRHLLAVLLL